MKKISAKLIRNPSCPKKTKVRHQPHQKDHLSYISLNEFFFF